MNLPFRICVLALFNVTITAFCISISSVDAQSVESSSSRPAGLPSEATWMPLISNPDVNVFRASRTLWLAPTRKSVEARTLSIPRLCAPIRSLHWQDDPDRELAFVPEPETWVFSWKSSVKTDPLIKVVFDGDPLLPDQCSPAQPAGDGGVMLFADHAETHGEKLRFEPQWYKNTVGYWTVPTDYANWELKIDAPGHYSLAVLQGCGKGQGGSRGLITLRAGQTKVAELRFETVDTGHFQNFRWIHLGKIQIAKPGEYELRIEAVSISKVALFDVRSIHLVKQAE
jgi:hypothetical protein